MEIFRNVADETKVTIGYHNENFDASVRRIARGGGYKDLSTVWICPTRGIIRPAVVASWFAMLRPINQVFHGPIFVEGEEVGDAYESAFKMILGQPEQYQYVLTLEDDNLPPPDGLLKLYESVQDYDCVGGLYWTKGLHGQPQIWGNPKKPGSFYPQIPKPYAIQPCNGLGMGFNLWKMSSFKKLARMKRPWFKTVQGAEGGSWTQDLWFFNKAAKFGWKVACDTRVFVGHIDHTGQVW